MIFPFKIKSGRNRNMITLGTRVVGKMGMSIHVQ